MVKLNPQKGMKPDYLSLSSVTFIPSSYYTSISASFLPSPINQHLSFTFFFTAFLGLSFSKSYVSHHTPLNFILHLLPPSLRWSQPLSRLRFTSHSSQLHPPSASSKPSLVTASFTFTFHITLLSTSSSICFLQAFVGHSLFHVYVSHHTPLNFILHLLPPSLRWSQPLSRLRFTSHSTQLHPPSASSKPSLVTASFTFTFHITLLSLSSSICFLQAFVGHSLFLAYFAHHTPLNFILHLLPPSLRWSQLLSRLRFTSHSTQLHPPSASSKPSLVTASFTFTFHITLLSTSSSICFLQAFVGHSLFHVYVSHHTPLNFILHLLPPSLRWSQPLSRLRFTSHSTQLHPPSASSKPSLVTASFTFTFHITLLSTSSSICFLQAFVGHSLFLAYFAHHTPLNFILHLLPPSLRWSQPLSRLRFTSHSTQLHPPSASSKPSLVTASFTFTFHITLLSTSSSICFLQAFVGHSLFLAYFAHHTPLNFILHLLPTCLPWLQPLSRLLCTSHSTQLHPPSASSMPSLVTASFTLTLHITLR